MSVQLYGRWHLEVTKAVHNWENRFVVAGATSGAGTYPPTVGLEVTADGSSWQLRGEYRESDADPWKPSDMMIEPGLERAPIDATIGSEDPLPQPDFEDIQWRARYLDPTMFEIAYRPWAVRTDDLFEMPDGIFETALGTYYMGVRVTNRWGLPFADTHVLDISPGNRADLAMRGIQVLDTWSAAELAALGQRQLGTGLVLGPLVPGASRTVYFKLDVAGASPRKHAIEFVCWNMAGMTDPYHSMRRITKNIFVSRTTVDSNTAEIVSEVDQGTLRLRLREFAFDRVTARKRRRRCPPEKRPDPGIPREKLRETLRALLEGKPVDPCVIHRILACYCPGGLDGGSRDPRQPRDGRFCYDPFYAFPTKFSYSVIPRVPYDGQHGPIPFDDPWWKVLLLIIAAVLLLAGALDEASDIAYQDEDLVIGRLGRFQRDDVDAALCRIETDRALSFLQVLDAQSDEDFQNPITALDGNVALNGPVLTRAEVNAIMTLPANDPLRQCFKSGARSGTTHGMMSQLAFTGHSLSTWNVTQLVIVRDPAFNEPVSQAGDSGSIWVQTQSLRPVALNHSGDSADLGTQAVASLLADVQTALNITIGG